MKKGRAWLVAPKSEEPGANRALREDLMDKGYVEQHRDATPYAHGASNVEPDMLVASLAYAAQGWAVLPLWWPIFAGDGSVRCACGRPDCASPAKHPIGRLKGALHGVIDASRDPREIRRWWERYPQANIGIATGAISGMWVLDVDVKDRGDRTLVDVVRDHGPLGDTLHAFTGGGGDHYFFRYGERVPSSRVRFGLGLDTRAAGGYVVAPPSMHASGERYAWPIGGDDVDILDAPDWLLSLVGAERKVNPVAAQVHKPAKPMSLRDLEVMDILVAECEFVRYCEAYSSSLSYDEWLSLATVLKAFGGEGERLFHGISGRDPARYREREAQKKLDSVRGAPRHCDHLGYSCSRMGECGAFGVQSPAGLPYKRLRAKADERKRGDCL